MDDLRPLGYDARVQHGFGGMKGREGGGEMGEEVPKTGIKVETEVRVDSSERLFYNDRLF